jgi:hypothetical protein
MTKLSSFLLLQGYLFHHKNFTLITSPKPNYLPKALSLNSITLGIRTTTYEFVGTQSFSRNTGNADDPSPLFYVCSKSSRERNAFDLTFNLI